MLKSAKKQHKKFEKILEYFKEFGIIKLPCVGHHNTHEGYDDGGKG